MAEHTTGTITFADLHAIMEKLNGYTGSPRNDNDNKIWADLDPTLQGEPYCAATDCYLWKHAGDPYPAIDHPWGFSYCPDGVLFFEKHGLWEPDSSKAEPGDTIFYNWDGNQHGLAEHTGTMVKFDAGAALPEHTFEGNTTPQGGAGDQSNGGGCYFRERPHDNTVLGVGKSSVWLADHPHHQAKPHPPLLHHIHHNPFKFDRHQLPLHEGMHDMHGAEDIHWVQWALGFKSDNIDGDYGPVTTHGVRIYQKARGLKVDGVVGPQTAASLSTRTRS